MADVNNIFPHIGHYRDAVASVRRYMLINKLEEYTVDYTGSVKIDGTNTSIVFDTDSIYFQSRNRVIDSNEDHFDFYNRFSKVSSDLKKWYENSGFAGKLCIYGEYAGEKISRKVGVAKIGSKVFLPFAMKLDGVWLDESKYADTFLELEKIGIFNYLLLEKNRVSVSIPFHAPSTMTEKFQSIASDIEQSCPIATMFNVNGRGEGMVFKPTEDRLRQFDDLWFKVKGDKKSASQSNAGASVSVEIIENISKILDILVTENRLRQGLDYLVETGRTVEMSNIGLFIRWVVNDVNREDAIFIKENNLNNKLLNKHIAHRCSKFYTDAVNRIIF